MSRMYKARVEAAHSLPPALHGGKQRMLFGMKCRMHRKTSWKAWPSDMHKARHICVDTSFWTHRTPCHNQYRSSCGVDERQLQEARARPLLHLGARHAVQPTRGELWERRCSARQALWHRIREDGHFTALFGQKSIRGVCTEGLWCYLHAFCTT